ncbi:hypothetical protein L227DRAFT_617028, partial [Lentinus tigrinus ALCF2SS1-6]
GRSYYDSPEIEGSQDQAEGQGTLEEVEEFDDGTWYMGKARDEFNRRRRGQHEDERAAPQDEDPVQWARDRRRAEAENEGDFGPEDYFDAATRGQRYREEEDVDEFAETMLLVVLCLMVSVLLYVRGRWVDRIRREEEERRRQANGNGNGNGNGQPGQQQQQRDGANPNGVFPPPGDPARDDWAILR